MESIIGLMLWMAVSLEQREKVDVLGSGFDMCQSIIVMHNCGFYCQALMKKRWHCWLFKVPCGMIESLMREKKSVHIIFQTGN